MVAGSGIVVDFGVGCWFVVAGVVIFVDLGVGFVGLWWRRIWLCFVGFVVVFFFIIHRTNYCKIFFGAFFRM